MRTNLLVGLLFLSGWAMASERQGFHALSVSAGIAEPSFSIATFQNPAGVKYSSGLQLNGEGGWGSSFNNPTYRGGVLYGTNSYGIAAGLGYSPSPSSSSSSSSSSGRSSSERSSGGDHTSAFLGLAAEVPQIKTTFGLSVFTGISPSGGSSFNLGAIISPHDQFHLGITAIAVDSSVQEWGGGISIDLQHSAALVIDATVDHDFKNAALQPGLLVHSDQAGLTVSYGTSGSQQISDGFSVGGSLVLGQSVTWEVYYNHLAKFFTSISFKL